MRYPDGQSPDPLNAYSENMHHMLTLSMVMAIVIGVALFFLGRHGNIMWLKVWSVLLVILAIAYLIADAINVF